MSGTIEGRFYPASAAHHLPALASAEANRTLRIAAEDGTVLAEVPARAIKATARLARLTRRLDLPGGARFETDDNDGADTLLRGLRRWRRGRFTDRLERAWPVVGLSLILSLAVAYYVLAQAVPVASEWLAQKILPNVAHAITEQALMELDRTAFTTSALNPADRAKAEARFRRVAAKARHGASGYRLVFRKADKLGPNAFALPDGTIVMTDSLWTSIKDDAEIDGVFAHEMSHVDHAHQLQRVLQAALVPATIAVFTGDMMQVTQMSAILPGLILQSAYSRRFETQADDDAATLLRGLGEKPSHMADLLERLDKKDCGKTSCPPGWTGDHPGTAFRAARLRLEDKGPIAPEDCLKPWQYGLSLHCLSVD